MRILPVLPLLAGIAFAASVDSAYRGQIEQYRQKREAVLKADGGWLTVTGLFWLKDGENTLGSDTANDVVLPDSAPARLGVIKLHDGAAVFSSLAPVATVNGKAVSEATLHSNETPDVLSSGAVELTLLKR